jgi:hypothetical protein
MSTRSLRSYQERWHPLQSRVNSVMVNPSQSSNYAFYNVAFANTFTPQIQRARPYHPQMYKYQNSAVVMFPGSVF